MPLHGAELFVSLCLPYWFIPRSSVNKKVVCLCSPFHAGPAGTEFNLRQHKEMGSIGTDMILELLCAKLSVYVTLTHAPTCTPPDSMPVGLYRLPETTAAEPRQRTSHARACLYQSLFLACPKSNPAPAVRDVCPNGTGDLAWRSETNYFRYARISRYTAENYCQSISHVPLGQID